MANVAIRAQVDIVERAVEARSWFHSRPSRVAARIPIAPKRNNLSIKPLNLESEKSRSGNLSVGGELLLVATTNCFWAIRLQLLYRIADVFERYYTAEGTIMVCDGHGKL